MKQYLDLLQHLKDNGTEKTDRTGVGTKSCFGYQLRTNLSKGFPLLTTKKVFLKGITYELLWFLSGSTNIKYLVENGVNIWNEWPFQTYLKTNDLEKEIPTYSEKWNKEFKIFIEKIKTDQEFSEKWGNLGPVYGKQWIRWESEAGPINQINDAINLIKNSPDSRRIIVSGWNVGDIQDILKGKFIAPPPCHTLFQFYVINNKLSCQLYQRSADVFLGVPFNIASYALLTMMIAQVCDLELGDFVHTFGDVHIYKNHYKQVDEQLSRTPSELPQMILNPKIKNIYDFKYEDFELKNYDPQAPIKAPIAV